MSSSQPPQPAKQPPANAPVEDRLTFPPFPQAPPGVTIIPFKQFKEHGIQMFATDSNEDVERDGLGIPTVELRVHHDTDFCKTETKRKRKAQKRDQLRTTTVPGARKEWWQHWAEAEDLRSTQSYNPNTSPLDRLYEAAAEFRKDRAWPPGPTGISALWDQFRLYVGLLSNTPVWRRTDKPQQDTQSDSDDDDFDDEPAESARGTKTNVVEADFEREPRKFNPRARARPPYALYDTEPIPVGSDEEVKHLLDHENARREESMVDFLNDPELKMKIFLSSYIRKQGLIWSTRNLVNIPRLLGFFIRFLLRGEVFPEPQLKKGLKRTLEVVDLAQKELILTSKLAKELPDKFSLACTSCFGQKADGYKPIAPITNEQAEKNENDHVEEAKDDTGEPESKRAKLDPAIADSAEAAKLAVERFEEELKAENVEVIRVDEDVLMKAAETPQVSQDNVNAVADAIPSWSQSTLGSPAADGAIPNWAELSSWGNPPADGEPDPWAIPPIEWAPPDVHSLLPLLGPTAFPLTHTTGAVECSIRRIKSFTPPPASNTLPKSPISGEEDPDAVDIELERRFAKLVLAPWPEWDKANNEMPHLAKPRILETSRGPIAGVVQPDGEVDQDAEDPVAAAIPEGVTPHDPFKDDITVWVEPAILPTLSLGLGLGGTWVQIARQQDFAGEGAKKKKKKGKSKKAAPRYWYIDELMMILPSYHT